MSDVAIRARTHTSRIRLAVPSPRRTLQLILGMVWLLDAALQFQPFMFSSGFVTKVIEPGAAGDPAFIARPITWAAQIMAHHLVLGNTMFALIQLAIAAGLFCRPTVKPALAASIAWSVSVWWFGEGLGMVLTGGSPLTGAPGAVILYALIALLLWPSASDRGAPALSGPLGRLASRLAWLLLWASFGWYLLQPGNRAPDAVSQVFAGAASGEPGWISSLENGLASVTAGHGLVVSLLLYGLCVLAGLAVFAGRLTRPGLILAGLLGLLFWIAEGFGVIATGQATDPNTGPLLILLSACFWPSHSPDTSRISRSQGGAASWE
jgi:hypothetical protein